MLSRRGFAAALGASAAALGLPRRVHAGDRPTVRIATLDWAPHVGPGLPGHGWLSDMVTRAFDRHGFDVDYRFLPWPRALEEALLGRHDAVMPMYLTPQRAERYAVSRPLPAGPCGFYARRAAVPEWDGQLSSLRGLHIGNVQGYALPLDMDPRQFRIDVARTDLLNLRKLAAGRIDLALVDFVVARHLLTEDVELRSALAPVSPSLGARPTVLGVARDHPDAAALMAVFDQGMDEILSDGTARGVLDAWGLDDTITLSRAAP